MGQFLAATVDQFFIAISKRAHIEFRAYIPIDDAEITLEELAKSPEITTLIHGLANLKAVTKSKKKEYTRGKKA